MVISYTWASNLVYTLTGSPRPAARPDAAAVLAAEAGGRGGGRGRGGRGGRGGAANGGSARGGAPRPALKRRLRADPVALATLQSLLARAERQVPTWRTMIIRLPQRAGGPVAFSMSDREYWNSFARSTLTLDGRSGADVRWEPYAATSLGQKARGWMRFAHTGELGGLVGEGVAGAASLGGGFLVYTGFALALRRLAAGASGAAPAPAPGADARSPLA